MVQKPLDKVCERCGSEALVSAIIKNVIVRICTTCGAGGEQVMSPRTHIPSWKKNAWKRKRR